MKWLTRGVAAAVLLLLAHAEASGQSAAINGEIAGTITDADGVPLAAAAVTATNLNTGYQRSATTTARGLYRLPVLPLGEYEIAVDAPGFSPYRQSGIAVTAGGTATIDVPLRVRGVKIEVTFVDSAPIVDAGRTDQGVSLDSYALRNLPLVSRNPFNFILQQPNVSGRSNSEFGVPRKVNANGFTGRINYQLDGSNNVQSDRAGIRLMPISETWVQEVQQVSTGFAPEFGNTVGTVFNSVTKSGVNDLHGEAGYLFRRTGMSARPALLASDRPAPNVDVDTIIADAGGHVVRDRIFFFGAFERVQRDLPAPVAVPASTIAELGLPAHFADPIPFRQNVQFFLGKVDLQVSNANRLALRYNGHRNDSPYNSSVIGGLYLVDRTYNFVDRSHGGAAQLVSTFTPSMVNEVRVQVPFRSQQQRRFAATGRGPAITIPGVANFGNSLDLGFRYDETTPEVSENFSYGTGAHAWKFGSSVRQIRDTKTEPTGANYTFPSIEAYLDAKTGIDSLAYTTFMQMVGRPSMAYKSILTSSYAQDTWKPRANMTMVYGVRYELYRPPSAQANVPFTWSQDFRTDRNNFAPRAGFAAAFGRTVFRASGGIFYDPFQTDMYRRALLNNGTPQYFSIAVTPGSPFAPSFPNVFAGIPQGFQLHVQDITTVAPDFASLYSINGNMSVSRELAPNLSLTATYLYTRGNRLPVYRNVNLMPSGEFLADGRPIFGDTRVFPQFANITAAESVGQSTYNGLNLTLSRRFARDMELFATYTWSHAVDDAPEQNNVDTGNFALSDPTNRRRDRGDSLIDRRHAFNGNVVFTPMFDFRNGALRYLANGNRLAATVVIQSGEVFNIGSNANLNNDPTASPAFQRPLFIGRNTLRAPATVELNVRYTRNFRVRERMGLEVIAESTNVLNHTNVTGINSSAPVAGDGFMIAAPSQAWTAALDQRLVQLGVRFSF